MLEEAHRVLRKEPEARLVVVEPFRRWWGRGQDTGRRTPDNFAAAVGRRCCMESHDVHDVAMQDGGELENQLLSALERWESAAAFTDAISNYIYDIL